MPGPTVYHTYSDRNKDKTDTATSVVVPIAAVEADDGVPVSPTPWNVSWIGKITGEGGGWWVLSFIETCK